MNKTAAIVLCVVCLAGFSLAQAPPPAEVRPWEFLSTSAIGAKDFLGAHPTWDGRGVVIAVIDTGVDARVQGLLTTSTGAPKILDLRDFSGQGDVSLEPAVLGSDTAGSGIHAGDGPWLRGHDALTPAPREGSLLVGYLREAALVGSDARDLNGDGREDGVFGVVVYASPDHEGAKRHVVVDTDGDGRLDDERVRADFLEMPEVFVLGSAERRDDRAPLAFALNLWDDRRETVTFAFDDSAHGTHVAGIAAGHEIGGQADQHGIAPGAQIISLKIGNNQLSGGATTSGSMWRAWHYAAAWSRERGVPVVAQMSYGVGSEDEGAAGMEAEIDRLLFETPALVGTVTNGNEGPGLSTAGLPSAAEHVIASGAVMNRATARDIYGVDLGGDRVFDFSSRGAETAKPDIVAPGFAASTVPAFRDGADVMRGTSMASPQTAGAAALLMSAAVAEGVPVRGLLVKAALRRGARPIPGATVLDQGPGMVDVPRAYEIYKALAGRGETEPLAWTVRTASPDMPGGEGPAAHWRGVVPPFAPDRQNVDVSPLFAASVTAQQKSDFYRAFDLVSTAPFVKPDRASVYTRSAKAIEFGLIYDPRAIASPGLYTARILAYEKGASRQEREKYGPEWDFPVSVAVPHEPAPGEVLTLPRAGVEPAGVERIFVRVPVGATGFTLRTKVAPGSADRVRTYLHDPEGRRHILPFAGRGPVDGIEKRVEGANLVPGTWEIVLFADRDNSATLGVDVQVAFDAFALAAGDATLSIAEGGTPRGSFALRNRSRETFQGTMTARLVGFRLEGESKAKAGRLEMPVEIGPAFERVDLHVETTSAAWTKITDVAVRLLDGSGDPLVSDGMSYRLLDTQLRRRDGAESTKATLRIDAALADPDANDASLPFTIARTYRLAEPIALELTDGNDIALYPDRAVALSFKAAANPPARPEGAQWIVEISLEPSRGDAMGAKLEFAID